MVHRNDQHCADKSRLLAEYNRSVTEWSHAVRSLSHNAGNEFTALLSKVDEARAKTHRAKAAYAAHIAEHGCDGH
jgi:hypothetical protein